jgi:hypothetical protein
MLYLVFFIFIVCGDIMQLQVLNLLLNVTIAIILEMKPYATCNSQNCKYNGGFPKHVYIVMVW